MGLIHLGSMMAVVVKRRPLFLQLQHQHRWRLQHHRRALVEGQARERQRAVVVACVRSAADGRRSTGQSDGLDHTAPPAARAAVNGALPLSRTAVLMAA